MNLTKRLNEEISAAEHAEKRNREDFGTGGKMRRRVKTLKAAKRRIDELEALVRDVAPFVGYQASVEDLKARVDAVAYPETSEIREGEKPK